MITSKDDKLFVLDTNKTTYAFRVMPTGHLEHLYYGRKIRLDSDDGIAEQWEFGPGNSSVYDKENSDVAATYSNIIAKIDDIRNGVVETISSNSVIGLRLVMTLTPIVVLVVAVLIFKSRYILTDKKLGEIITELKAREA